MSKSTIIVLFFLTLFFKYSKGVANASIPDDVTNDSNGIAEGINTCCSTGRDYSFALLADALKNVSSNDVITITTSVELSSVVSVRNVENLTIIGYGNPTVNCNGIGALRFVSCYNISIEDINWKECGLSSEEPIFPAIEFYNSSKITVQNCSFQQSRSRAINLSKVSGNVYMNSCQFTNNTCYSGHGAGIHYISESDNQKQLQLSLVIDSCEFSFNGAAKSLVYCESAAKNSSDHVNLQNSVFISNQGVPVYIQNTTLHLKGDVLFEHNMAPVGGAVFSGNSKVFFDNKSKVMFNNNSAEHNGGGIFLNASRMYFIDNSSVTFISNSAESQGGAVYLTSTSHVQFSNRSLVTFQNNKASTYGGALCCRDHSNISFDDDTTVEFIGNYAFEGGAVFLLLHSSVSFSGNTMITFNENKAGYGGALALYSSCNALLNGQSILTFNSNNASLDGGGLYCTDNNNVLFDGSTKVMFHGNIAAFGGALYSEIYSKVSFSGNSTINFDHNEADIGGAIYIEIVSITSCNGNSSLEFHRNSATYGGAVYFESSSLLFDGTSIVTFYENSAEFGGAVSVLVNSNLSFIGSSTVMFAHNSGTEGGAIFAEINSVLLFSESSSLSFTNNFGSDEGGAIKSKLNCSISFEGKSEVMFKDNSASSGGGAIFSEIYSYLIFNENSNVAFRDNTALYGGALKFRSYSDVSFHENSKVIFTNNSATYGGALYFEINNEASFGGNSALTFIHNVASVGGGAVAIFIDCRVSFNTDSVIIFSNNSAPFGGSIYSGTDCNLTFDGYTAVMFKGNEASESGGAIVAYSDCTVSCNGNSSITFVNNSAGKGAAIHIYNCDMLFEGNSKLNFSNNNAVFGGAIHSSSDSQITARNNSILSFNNNIVTMDGGVIYAFYSHIKFENNSASRFYDNKATRNGGAIFLTSHSTILLNTSSTFLGNSADSHGGAIYGELTENTKSNIISNPCCVNFLNNAAFMGPEVYMHLDASCDETCLNTRVIGLNITHNYPPLRLVLNDPAVCMDDKNITSYCLNYVLNNIMLGEEITIDACVLSVFDQPAGATDFFLNDNSSNHEIDGSNYVSIACSTFKGISIIGRKISQVSEFPMSITLIEDSTKISINLTVELSPCHLGFQHDVGAQRCTCYNSSEVVSCSRSMSTIKRGYWFGIVDGKTTVTVCPNNYCDFTCCEAGNGFYQLSPVRINQCLSHRSGTACGSCEQGYTLSFDSVHCIRVNKCSTGLTVLVVTLSVIYWITLVVVVFVAMYYKIEIGYLYAITYYFSIVDILLGQMLYLSQGLLTTVSILSSIAKVTPQFLGQLCFVKSMSGIDQHFIHYAHPLAVTIIVAMICLLARMSYKFSSFVSRGIIHVVCFLLLLSYTSVAATSLLLLRSLTFYDVDKTYAYLSPDLEYFHGRHLPYAIIAILCTLVIVIGLPLVLLLEPFLNHKINFTRIKPLLDQFQGCYKDKYRCFAAYYMICRLVIILLVITNPSNATITQFLLVAGSTISALIQLILRPYASEALNVFDGVILQIMILVSITPLVESLDQDLSISIAFTLVLLPLINFAIMEVLVNKEGIKRLTRYCRHENATKFDTRSNEISIDNFSGVTIGDTLRTNASYYM